MKTMLFRFADKTDLKIAQCVTVANTGHARIYHDAFTAVNGVRAGQLLKGLASGQNATFEIASGGAFHHRKRSSRVRAIHRVRSRLEMHSLHECLSHR
jgi:hypothetical protein